MLLPGSQPTAGAQNSFFAGLFPTLLVSSPVSSRRRYDPVTVKIHAPDPLLGVSAFGLVIISKFVSPDTN